MTRTFLDAGVLISATTGRDALFDRARDILDDPERVFLSSDLVRPEVLPKARYFPHQGEQLVVAGGIVPKTLALFLKQSTKSREIFV